GRCFLNFWHSRFLSHQIFFKAKFPLFFSKAMLMPVLFEKRVRRRMHPSFANPAGESTWGNSQARFLPQGDAPVSRCGRHLRRRIACLPGTRRCARSDRDQDAARLSPRETKQTAPQEKPGSGHLALSLLQLLGTLICHVC